MSSPLLELKSLSHVFPDGKQALDNVNLSIPAGTFLILAGANGSGKTVLMRHLNGLARPTSGAVLFQGIPVLDNLAHVRRSIGLIFQNTDAQIVGQTVAKDTAFGPENLRLPLKEIDRRVQASLDATGLVGFNHRRPHTLSEGEKRRLAVAGVLAMEPDIIVLDEPFTGLDWMGCADLLTVLDNFRQSGKTVILITHDLAKVLAHADRLLLMDSGCIKVDGSPQDVIDQVEELSIRRPFGNIAEMSWNHCRGKNSEGISDERS